MKTLTQDQLDKISGEFGSTFVMAGPNKISNLLSPYEVSKVIGIIERTVPWDFHVHVKMTEKIDENMGIWTLELFSR